MRPQRWTVTSMLIKVDLKARSITGHLCLQLHARHCCKPTRLVSLLRFSDKQLLIPTYLQVDYTIRPPSKNTGPLWIPYMEKLV